MIGLARLHLDIKKRRFDPSGRTAFSHNKLMENYSTDFDVAIVTDSCALDFVRESRKSEEVFSPSAGRLGLLADAELFVNLFQGK